MRRLMILPLLVLALTGCGRKSIDEQLEEGAKQETMQMCPRKMDDWTVMDSIVYDIPTRTRIYYYTVTGEMANEDTYTEFRKTEFRENHLKSLRNDIGMKRVMDSKVNIAYVYLSATTGKPVFKMLFTKDDYTGPMKLRSFDEHLVGKWEDYTARCCPEEQDVCTVLDSVVYRPGERTLCYSFSLKGELDVKDFDDMFPAAAREMKKVLVKGIVENESLKEEKDSALTFNFQYYSQSRGRLLMDISIDNQEIANEN